MKGNWLNVNEEKVRISVLSLVFAIGIGFIGKIFVKNIFLWFSGFGILGLDNVANQMDFCFNKSIYLLIFSILIFSFIIDKFILKFTVDHFFRKVYWITLIIFILLMIIRYYGIIHSVNNDKYLFESMKHLICY